MGDPTGFIALYNSIKDPEERKRLAQSFVLREEQGVDPNLLFPSLVEIGQRVGTDLTQFVSWAKPQQQTPLSPEVIDSRLTEAEKNVPFFRKIFARMGGALETYQEHVVEPSAAMALASIFALIPGEQPLDRQVKQAIQTVSADRKSEGFLDRIRDFRDGASAVYAESDFGFGVKGTMETLFDPLNLLGLGVPAKLGKAIPLLKPLMFPFKVIDEAPAALVSRGIDVLKVPFTGVKITESMARAFPQLKGRIGEKIVQGVPVLRSLADPASVTRVIRATKEGMSVATDAFGARRLENNPAVTADVISNLHQYPASADPRSLQGLMVHIANETPGRGWEELMEEWNALTPDDFIKDIGARVGLAEERALAKGGKLLSGEEVEGLSERRIEAFGSLIDKVHRDVKWRNGIAQGVDDVLVTLEGFWMQKVEPMFIRPWSVAVLGTMSYVPLNIVEDIGISVAGLGRAGGFNDGAWRTFSTGLGAPSFLNDATTQAIRILDSKAGLYRERPTRGILGKVTAAASGRWIVETSAALTIPIQRHAWNNMFFKRLPGRMKAHGIQDADFDRMRTLVDTSLPANAQHLRQEFTEKAWVALASDDPVRAFDSVIADFESNNIILKDQRDLFREYGELPTDARHGALRRINAGEAITAANKESFRQEMLEDVIDHHRYSGEAMKAEIEPIIQALKVRDPQTLDESMSLLRSMNSMGDQLTSLPREVRARARIEAKAKPAQAKEIWAESLRVIGEDIGELRTMYAEALELAEPRIKKQLLKTVEGAERRSLEGSINDVFLGSRNISDNLNKTWIEYREGVNRILEDGARKFDYATRQELDAFGAGLWNAEKRDRAREAERARQGWRRAFDLLRKGVGKETDKTFIRDSLHAQFGEALQKIDDFRSELFRLENTRRTAPSAVTADLDQRILSLKEILVSEQIASRDLQRSIGKISPRSLRQREPTLVDKYTTDERTLRASITRSEKAGHFEIAETSRKQLTELTAEKQKTVEQFIPAHQRREYRQLLQTREQLSQLTAGIPDAQKKLQPLTKRINQIERLSAQGEGVRVAQNIGDVSQDLMDSTAAKVVERIGRPGSTEEVVDVVTALANEGDTDAQLLINLLTEQIESADDVMTRVFGKTTGLTEARELTDLQVVTLRSTLQQPDTILTPTTQELVDKGFLTQPITLPNRRVRVQATDKGQAAIDTVAGRDIDIKQLTSGLPEPLRQFDSALELEVDRLDTFLGKAVGIAENPSVDDETLGAIRSATNTIKQGLGQEKQFSEALKLSRKEAAVEANAEFSKLFVNYDEKTTFDWIMNRLFPFWMYESRRWPRLINLAGRRPALGKHFAMSLGDWEYGHTDVGSTGFQYTPFKGVMASTFRSVAARDYPEYHNDWRKYTSAATGAFGRFGFPPTPAITAPLLLAEGRIAEAIPPPITTMVHAYNAFGGKIPAPLEDLFFSSRFYRGAIDKVLADEFNENPAQIQARVEDGDEEAIAVMDAAKKQASRIIITEQQSSVLNWRPKVRQEFLESGEQAFAEIMGVSVESQETAKKLGIPLTSLIPVSGSQWKAMRETIPNFDAQVNRGLALLPKDEQERVVRHVRFWMSVDDMNEESDLAKSELSAEWERAAINGLEWRRENSKIASKRAIAFNTLKEQPQFADVPMTIEEKIEYKTRFGNPPPLVHPVDELREQYYALDPEAEEFIDSLTGETNWSRFFGAREEILRSAPDAIQATFRRDRLARATPAERAYESALPWIRVWQEIPTLVNEAFAESDPDGATKHQAYRLLKNRAVRARNLGDIPLAQFLEREAQKIAAITPLIVLAERQIRFQRDRKKATVPQMRRVHELWIASPP